jgi:UDP-N-acetylmuramoyl-tripeptide--D-alanyl-D-alanine ligase
VQWTVWEVLKEIKEKQETSLKPKNKNDNSFKNLFQIIRPRNAGLLLYYFCPMSIEELYQIYLQHPYIQTDSRKLKKGELFFALKGPTFNGNKFTKQVLDEGASYAIIDDADEVIGEKTILVNDVLQTLQQLATYHRKQFDNYNDGKGIPFIAITGSNGKTTTKELIHAVLSTTYKTYTTEGNLNNHIGVPLTLLKIEKDAQMAVIEMGANHQKEIASYCEIALPTHGLITNCGKAHLEGFGSIEGVRKGKGELFDFLRINNGTAFIMNDYAYLTEMSKGINNIFKYGTSEADVVGFVKEKETLLSVEFKKGFPGFIETNLVGDYNLPNVLAAIALGVYFKVPEEKIRTAIKEYHPSNSRSQLLERLNNTIILDAYNANPSSMKVAIENFAQVKGNNKVVVLGAMAELGEDSIEEHKAIIDQLKKHEWKHVLLVGGDFLKIDHPFISATSATEAGEWISNQDFKDHSFLLKGSRTAQIEKVLDYL